MSLSLKSNGFDMNRFQVLGLNGLHHLSCGALGADAK